MKMKHPQQACTDGLSYQETAKPWRCATSFGIFFLGECRLQILPVSGRAVILEFLVTRKSSKEIKTGMFVRLMLNVAIIDHLILFCLQLFASLGICY